MVHFKVKWSFFGAQLNFTEFASYDTLRRYVKGGARRDRDYAPVNETFSGETRSVEIMKILGVILL